MNRYPHNPWAPAIAAAAVAATALTLAVAVLVPAKLEAPAAAQATAVAQRGDPSAVVLDRIDVVASRPADKASVVPAGMIETKGRS